MYQKLTTAQNSIAVICALILLQRENKKRGQRKQEFANNVKKNLLRQEVHSQKTMVENFVQENAWEIVMQKILAFIDGR